MDLPGPSTTIPTQDDNPPPVLEKVVQSTGSQSGGSTDQNSNRDITDNYLASNLLMSNDNVAAVAVDSDHEPVSFPMFADNVCYHKLSSSERITLATKYLDVPEKVENRKKKDEHEIIVDEKDKLVQSFPIHDTVSSAFSSYVQGFEKAAFKTLAAGEGASGESVQKDSAGPGTRSTPASNRYDIKSGFMVPPTIEKWEFKTHYRDIPQVVTFDGNIDQIKSDTNVSNPSNIKLTDGEWGNLQKASSYSLRAISHASWFRDAAFGALNEALPLLDPSVPANAKCIETLIDAKQFLIGLEYAFEKIAKYSVYPHAGVTSVLRRDFLQNESKQMLLEERSKLFSLPYGKSFVFQGMVDTVAEEVKKQRETTLANKQLDATIKLGDSLAHQGKGSGGGGYHNTRSSAKNTFTNNSPLNSTPGYYQPKKGGFQNNQNNPKSFPKSSGAGRGGGQPPSLQIPTERG